MANQRTHVTRRNQDIECANIDVSGVLAFDTPSVTSTPQFSIGTGTSDTVDVTQADYKAFTIYLNNSATSGDNRAMYVRQYLSGAGGGGEAARIFSTVNDVAAGTVHGAHISLSFASTGSVTGQGIASRNTLHIPNAAMSGGTVSALQAEIYADGASSDISGTTNHSVFRVVLGGNATGAATVSTFMDMVSVPAAGDGAFLNTNATVLAAAAYAALAVETPAGTKYLRLYDAS